VSRCPTCRGAVAVAPPRPRWFPFCSERCQWIDLGKWLDEEYRVPDPSSEPDPGR
jgi:uncharacterized protein